MHNEIKLLGGAMTALAFATAALVIVPRLQLAGEPAPAGLKPYSAAQLRGRQVYIANGCIYCHSQQPRDTAQAPDVRRGWGRASVAADYVYDKPHLLGTMRTGPDLFNVGARQPSVDWHLGHLYQPRAYAPGSLMSAYPFLFQLKDAAAPGDRIVHLPAGVIPPDKVLVARQEALDLVAYLTALNHTYPVAARGARP